MKTLVLKKAIIAAVIVLAVVTASCDFFGGPKIDDGIVGYTEDGRPLVQLTIGTGGSAGRAMAHEFAVGAVDFYEVVFNQNGTYYRTSWHKGQTGIIILPRDGHEYQVDATEAICFAGIYSSKLLLAVGLLDVATTIDINTTEVTFELVSLNTDVSFDALTTTFKITEPVEYFTEVILGGTILHKYEDIRNQAYPIYLVPNDTSGIEATYDITASAGDIGDYVSGIIVTEAEVRTHAYYGPDDDYAPINSPTITNNPAGALALPLELAFDTRDNNGLCGIFIELTVQAIDVAAGGIEWNIWGGTFNHQLDAGKDVLSRGGAVLLGIGDLSSTYIIVNADP